MRFIFLNSRDKDTICKCINYPLFISTFARSKQGIMATIKNIAIIAHVDHGKTTLVDKIMYHCQLFRENENTGDLILDNNDLERERGITITSKNVSVIYKDTKINIIDTPGHADFGVVINKVDKENCTPDEVHEKVFDLMFELGAEEWQLDFPTVYGSAKHNWMSEDWNNQTENIEPLLDMVIDHIPEPKIEEGTTQMLITSLDFSSFTGRIAIGRLTRGELKVGQQISLVKRDGSIVKSKIKELHTFEGLGRKKVEQVQTGDICAIVGLEGFEIGDTVADIENPFFGKDGKFVTSRHIKERLTKELEKNLALRVEETGSADKFMVFGRGVLHLSVLIETMRREGYDYCTIKRYYRVT